LETVEERRCCVEFGRSQKMNSRETRSKCG